MCEYRKSYERAAEFIDWPLVPCVVTQTTGPHALLLATVFVMHETTDERTAHLLHVHPLFRYASDGLDVFH